MGSETLSLVLIVVGTMTLILIMSSSCSGETYRRNSPMCRCGCRDTFVKTNQTQRDGPGTYLQAITHDGFSSRQCPYADDGAQPTSIANMDYGNAIKKMGLEDEVQKSHDEWLGEFSHRTTTASKETIRDDPNNVVTPIGLAAMMRQGTQYRTRAQPLAESRTIPSDIPCEMGGTKPSLTFYQDDPE